jgi:hypothetical protein
LLAAGAVLAGLGAAWRAGESSSNSSYYLDALAWLVVAAGAAVEAVSANLFFQVQPRFARRRALLLAIPGVIAGIAGCYLASAVFDSDSSPFAAGVANAALVGGIGAGLAGFFSLAWFYGGAYAARRIEKLSEEDW